MSIILFFIISSFCAFASGICHLDVKKINKMNYEEVTKIALGLMKNNCNKVVSKEVEALTKSNPNFFIIHFFLNESDVENQKKQTKEERLSPLKKACGAGVVDACFVYELSSREEKDTSIQFAYKYCQQNGAFACAMIGADLDEKKYRDAKAYLKKACSLRSLLGCGYLKTYDNEIPD